MLLHNAVWNETEFLKVDTINALSDTYISILLLSWIADFAANADISVIVILFLVLSICVFLCVLVNKNTQKSWVV